jgi:hypothetical protein
MDDYPGRPPQKDERVLAVPQSLVNVPTPVWVVQHILIAVAVLLSIGSLIQFANARSWTSLVLGSLLAWFIVQWHRGQWTTVRVAGSQLEEAELPELTGARTIDRRYQSHSEGDLRGSSTGLGPDGPES